MFRRVVAFGLLSFVVGGLFAVSHVSTTRTSNDEARHRTTTAEHALLEAIGSVDAPAAPEVAGAAPDRASVSAAPPIQDPPSGGPQPPSGLRPTNVHPDLLAAATGMGDTSNHAIPDPRLTVDSDGYVPISALAQGSSAELLRDLQGLGLVDGATNLGTVSGRLPAGEVARAAGLPTLRYMRPEWTIRSTGTVDSQGDKALKADLARHSFPVTGKGITVGILSDSFDCLGSASDDVAGGDLPAQISVIKEGDCTHGSDEGRAMAQIVADVAPDATLKFRTVDGGPFAMRNGIRDLVEAGADVIVDDIAYPSEPWFQDGVAAQAVDAAEAAGVSYFSAAGNSGHASYEGPFDDAGVRGPDAEIRLHDFDPGAGVDVLQRVTLGPQSIVLFELQWSDNFKTQVPNGPAPDTDLDFIALGADGVLLDASFMPNLTTLEPFELMAIPNFSDAPLAVDLGIVAVKGPDPRFVKWSPVQTIGRAKLVIDEHATSGATMFGHSQAAGAIAVGAANYKNTPAFGTSPPVAERFSSRGGTPIVVGQDGLPLQTAFKRQKPEIVAPDKTNTTFFGVDSSDDDSFPNFPGTSAAAPHAAGVAALLLEKVPAAGPIDVCNAMATTAIDMGPSGFDFDSGYGLVDADAALRSLTQSGVQGPCDAPTIEVPIVTPPAEPSPVVAPGIAAPVAAPAAAPVAAPVAPPPPPTEITTTVSAPSPTPPPVRPLLFANETEVVAGSPIQVDGWYLPKQSQFDISLDGEQTLGSGRSDANGRLSMSVTTPPTVSEGAYRVVATSRQHRVAAARPVVIHGAAIRQAASAAAPVAPASTGSGRTVVVLVLFAVLAVVLLVLRLKLG